jgi:hypothetical protein
MKIDTTTDRGIIRKKTGRIPGRINLIFVSLFTKSPLRAAFLDLKIITSDIRKGAMSPGSIRSIYRPLRPS